MDWHPGDRVSVRLPDRHGIRGRPNAWAWWPGTVREVDPPGRRPGVIVDLDQPANTPECFATHAELHALTAASGPR